MGRLKVRPRGPLLNQQDALSHRACSSSQACCSGFCNGSGRCRRDSSTGGGCEDDPTWKMTLNNRREVDCGWVSRGPEERCDEVSDEDVIAFVACLEACGQCASI